jgi:rhamnulokinase
MSKQVYLAVDLGASGGRVLAGEFDGEQLRLEELHRFENGAVLAAGHFQWDVLRLWSEITSGLRSAASKFGRQVQSVGVDSWGVDFGLVGRNDTLLGNPFSYRDRRTEGMMDRAFATVSREQIFEQTGLQFMPFNTLYQLLAMRIERSPLLNVAESFLMIPDLFHWMLTGVKANEATNASNTQFYNPTRRSWANELLAALDLPIDILGELVDPGTKLGRLRSDVAADTGLSDVEVVLPGTHDTASAVMAVPASGAAGGPPDWCYISSGTWSLMGVELPEPVINERCRQLNFTNEGGIGQTTRLLKNITGLWLVQECRRIWALAGQKYSWDELSRMAEASPALVSLINPDDPSLTAPANMPDAIREFCRRTNQPVPEAPGAVVRCALDSLGLKYRYVLEALEDLTGQRLTTIHIVGGGVQNRLLCQLTADACSRTVVAGPAEATAIGNLMTQAITAGAVGSIAEAREVIRRSFPVEVYQPRDAERWSAAYGRMVALCGG